MWLKPLLMSASHFRMPVESWLLSFQSSFLLMCLGRQWERLSCLGPCHACGRPEWRLSQTLLWWLFEKGTSRWKSVCVCLSLSVCLK